MKSVYCLNCHSGILIPGFGINGGFGVSGGLIPISGGLMSIIGPWKIGSFIDGGSAGFSGSSGTSSFSLVSASIISLTLFVTYDLKSASKFVPV